ncbi:amino acid:proton antiporter [Virgibacillus dokdonensis]|uniref:Amino acid:proton antiporter n=1 Tax=Virgibacillus dokdonensis TaxID=302167 RepID=A0A3E0WNJ6_9BACI|nr:APC family permease [Virgibacillus dokdonensis]RFA33525.1 amino acid:proton antiporter [Virgibacillus dokdonensis]
MGNKKKLRLFDSVLLAVTVVLVVESVAPAAAIGPSQFFWWALLLVGFFLPYGLVSAELGTTYDDEGGIFDWVKRAFGARNGGRVAWYYWVNYPLWMGSLAVLIPTSITQILDFEFNTISSIIISLVFIWLVTVVSFFRISESKWILNVAALFKVLIMVSLGGIGLYFAFTQGVANEFNLKTMLPSLDITSLSFLSVIIFNFLGFEVVTSMAGEMNDPQKEIPKALVMGGLLIAVFYVLAAFGIGVAVPFEQLTTDSGLLDSFFILLGPSGKWFVTIIGLMFIFTLIANLVSWAYGVNYVTLYASENKTFPKIFKWKSKSTDMPIGAPLINGIIASILVLLVPAMEHFGLEDIFWSFFALNLVTLLASYIFMFPAFLKLRTIDPDRNRPFKVKASGILLKLIAYVPLILLIISVIFTVVPLNLSSEEIALKLPLFVGTIISIIIGELVVNHSLNRKGE